MVYRWHMRWQMSGMLIPRYSFQFAQTFSLPFSPPLCCFIRVYMQIIQDVHAQLVTKGGSSTLCSPPPKLPTALFPTASSAFLGQSLCKTCPKFMKKPRKRGGGGAEVAAHLNVLHVLAMLAKLHVAGWQGCCTLKTLAMATAMGG